MIDAASFDKWFQNNDDKIIADLLNYLAIDTTSPNESDAFPFLHKLFQGIGAKTWEEKIIDKVIAHPERCPPPMSKITPESRNFMARLESETSNSQEAILISCHVDVVPAGPSWKEAFQPKVVVSEGGEKIIYGRGACDTKGNLLMVIGALRFLQDAEISLTKHLIFDCVIEEEIGGAGALSTALSGIVPKVIGAIVLEPTSLQCFRGHRGCIGVSVRIKGKSGHMGASKAKGPIHAVGGLVQELEALEEELIKLAKQDNAFCDCARPVQINVGRIEGGEWHGTAMEDCLMRVNVGFPPQYSLEKIEERLRAIISKRSDETGLEHILLCDGLRNEAYLDGVDAVFQKNFVNAVRDTGIDISEPKAWHVSCDGRTYAKKMGVPTVIFGCGDLHDAHSSMEKLALSSLKAGAFIMAHYLSS
jgi:acetylornithine deacetylase